MIDGVATQAEAPARVLLGVGRVRHLRLRPVRHGFEYPTWFWLLPMRTLARRPEPLLKRNGRGWASFHDADHGDGGSDALSWFDGLLRARGIADADGEVWLHTMPRVLGFSFKPVSFWYAHRRDGSLAAIVAEVNNTFGGRHAYLLAGPSLGWGRELAAAKDFQVSPFNRVEGGYRFRFLRTAAVEGAPARTVARIDYDDAGGALLQTSVSGTLAPLDAARLRAVLWRMPWQSLGVVLRIHLQALRLLLRRVPFVGSDGRAAAPHAPPSPRPSVHPN